MAPSRIVTWKKLTCLGKMSLSSRVTGAAILIRTKQYVRMRGGQLLSKTKMAVQVSAALLQHFATTWTENLLPGNLLRKGVDRLFQNLPYSFYSYFLWARTVYEAPAENKCGDTNKISKAKCESAILEAMKTCDPNASMSRGASANGSCISYVSFSFLK